MLIILRMCTFGPGQSRGCSGGGGQVRISPSLLQLELPQRARTVHWAASATTFQDWAAGYPDMDGGWLAAHSKVRVWIVSYPQCPLAARYVSC